MLQHPDGLCHPERSEGSVNVSKATVLTYSDSSSYRPQNDIDSIEKLLAKVEHFIDKPGKFKVSSPGHPNYQEEKQERKTFPCPVHLLIVPLQH